MRAGRPERACGADLVRCALLRSAREDSAISGTCAWRSAANVLRGLLWECMMIYHAPAPVHGRSAGACPPCTLAGQTPARDSIKECGIRPEDVEEDVRVVVNLLANASTTLDLYLLMMLYCIVL